MVKETMASHLQLILGGARSGKSRYALTQGNEDSFERRIFLATAMPADEEMKTRIEHHQMERSMQWKTVEETYYLPQALQKLSLSHQDLIVIDCATLWISNLLCGMGGKKISISDIEKQFKQLIQFLSEINGTIRIVSNEVGLGIVPEMKLGRDFRDLQGSLNQQLAVIANQVIVMVAGLPLKVK
jgi:adenosylcobinamide kinase/adenosylcobinamide-phosphate guanylyltransferase